MANPLKIKQKQINSKQRQTKSLPNTKLRKNIIQHILITHLAGDLTEVVQGAADIGGEQVAGEFVVEGGTDIMEGFGGFF